MQYNAVLHYYCDHFDRLGGFQCIKVYIITVIVRETRACVTCPHALPNKGEL